MPLTRRLGLRPTACPARGTSLGGWGRATRRASGTPTCGPSLGNVSNGGRTPRGRRPNRPGRDLPLIEVARGRNAARGSRSACRDDGGSGRSPPPSRRVRSSAGGRHSANRPARQTRRCVASAPPTAGHALGAARSPPGRCHQPARWRPPSTAHRCLPLTTGAGPRQPARPPGPQHAVVQNEVDARPRHENGQPL